MRHRLYAALALALALALLIATASFAGSSRATSSPSTTASLTVPDDGRGDVAVTATPQPLLAALLVALAVVALVLAPPIGAGASPAHLARAPPPR